MVRLNLVCAAFLGLFFSFCFAQDQGFKDVFPEADKFVPVKQGAEVIYYKAEDKEGKLLGAVFIAVGKSYADNIETLAGLRPDGTITAIKVLSQNETPGIGSRITEPVFTDQFRNIRDVSGVQAITGASVSCFAVIESVRKKAEEIRSLLKREVIR